MEPDEAPKGSGQGAFTASKSLTTTRPFRLFFGAIPRGFFGQRKDAHGAQRVRCATLNGIAGDQAQAYLRR
jgi:hypothetical protein